MLIKSCDFPDTFSTRYYGGSILSSPYYQLLLLGIYVNRESVMMVMVERHNNYIHSNLIFEQSFLIKEHQMIPILLPFQEGCVNLDAMVLEGSTHFTCGTNPTNKKAVIE